MKVEDLQNAWSQAHVEEMSQSTLIRQLFMESRQSKISIRLNRMIVYSVLFMVFNLGVVIISWLTMLSHLSNRTVVVGGILAIVLSKVVFFLNVIQIGRIKGMSFDQPVTKLQQTLMKLKVNRIRHNRFIFIFSNIYFWLMVTLLFRWDLEVIAREVWMNAPIALIIHVGMLVGWFPVAIWLLKKYDTSGRTSKFWNRMKKDSYLTDASVNSSLNEVLGYLDDIRSFRKE